MTGARYLFLLVAGLGFAGSIAAAQSSEQAPSDTYDACLSGENVAFEQALEQSLDQTSGANFDMVGGGAFDFCGVLEIAACDATDDRFACQAALTERMDGVRAEIRAGLPAPNDIAGLDPIWSDGLYPNLWAVVQGQSAGPDCAGAEQAYAVWCEAREASRRLADVITLRQVARVLGVLPALETGPSTTAGESE